MSYCMFVDKMRYFVRISTVTIQPIHPVNTPPTAISAMKRYSFLSIPQYFCQNLNNLRLFVNNHHPEKSSFTINSEPANSRMFISSTFNQ